MTKEDGQYFEINSPFIQEMQCGIKDTEYLETLLWHKNIRVINYKPYRRHTISSYSLFKNMYEQRQTGLIRRLKVIGEFIAENDLQAPEDLQSKHMPFLAEFVQETNNFFSETTFVGLSAKTVELNLLNSICEKYPHIDPTILSTPSRLPADVFRVLKEGEFTRGQNDDFARLFCCGDLQLASRIARPIDQGEEKRIRDDSQEMFTRKGYVMLGREDVQLLDQLLVLDNSVERWLWKQSWAMAPLYHVYNVIQEVYEPSCGFVKERYTFDIQSIGEFVQKYGRTQN